MSFSYHLRMLAFVPRWQIAPRFRTQSVAEHSFFVASYAMVLPSYCADEWSREKLSKLMEAALQHDAPEFWTGDMPGPVKRQVVDKEKLADLEDEAMERLGEFCVIPYDDDILSLVKVADLIDEMFHLATEIAMGNSLIRLQYEITRGRFYAATAVAEVKAGLKGQEVRDIIEKEIESMRRGVELPVNDSRTDPLTTPF